MIWVSDDKCHISYVSDEWQVLTGRACREALGNGWISAVHPEDSGMVIEGFAEACRLQTEFVLRYRLRQRNGSYIWVLGAATPSLTPLTREFIGYLGILSRYGEPPPNLTAKADIGAFEPGKAMAEFGPITQLDLVADHLIMAKAAATGCAREVATAIDLALHTAAQALIADQQRKRLSAKPH